MKSVWILTCDHSFTSDTYSVGVFLTAFKDEPFLHEILEVLNDEYEEILDDLSIKEMKKSSGYECHQDGYTYFLEKEKLH